MVDPTENMPILYQNIMFGLPSKLAQDAFLWATDRPGEDRMCYRAEKFAREVDHIVNMTRPMIKLSAGIIEKQRGLSMSQDQEDDLVNFILKRHANWRFEGNQSPSYC